MSTSGQVNLIFPYCPVTKTFISQREFAGHSFDFMTAFPLDERIEHGSVPSFDDKIATIIVLMKPEDPGLIKSCAMIPYIADLNIIIFTHVRGASSAKDALVVLSASGESSLINSNRLCVSTHHVWSVRRKDDVNISTHLE